MKKGTITIVASTVLALSACDQQGSNTTAVQTPNDTSTFNAPRHATNNMLATFGSFLNRLDTLDANTAAIAADKYKEFFQQEPVNTRDSGYVLFNNYYERLERNLNELHEKDTADYMPFVPGYSSETKAPATDKQKHYVESLHKNGFQLASEEGMTYIQPDLDIVANWFSPLISPTLKEYLAQRNKENKEGFAADAGLTISPEQYVDRVVWWEDFIKNNPSLIVLKEAKEQQQYLLTFLLYGMDNTPVNSYLDSSLETYYQTAYTYLQKKYPATETNQLVQPYFRALQQKDKTKATALLKEYSSKGYIMKLGE